MTISGINGKRRIRSAPPSPLNAVGRFRGSGRSAGFTLIEIILVAVLMAISVAVGAPYFAQSIRGNRLRVGARTVTMCARYARSMAVMRQQTFRLAGSVDSGELHISGDANDTRGLHTGSSIDAGDFSDADSAAVRSTAAPAVRRELDGVRIIGYRVGGGDWETEGSFEAWFYPNGTCTAFSLRLRERGGRMLLVQVDELGSVSAVPWEGRL